MARSLKKGPFFDNIYSFWNKKKKFVWSRRSVVLPWSVKKRVGIYNGKYYRPLLIKKETVGHKFGEFANTRKKGFPKKKQKKKK